MNVWKEDEEWGGVCGRGKREKMYEKKRVEGIREKLKGTCRKELKKGKTAEEIAELLEEDPQVIKELKEMHFCIQDNEIYYINENGEKAAEVTFPRVLDADTVKVITAFVSRSLRGTGMAEKLMQTAAEEISKTGKRAVLLLMP